MLTTKEASFLQKKLSDAKNPLFIYDSDPDGLCSYLLLRRFSGVGNGVRLIGAKKVTLSFLQKVRQEGFDAVFILDIADVEQEFLDAMNCPVYWIDHHSVIKRNKVNYYNPRLKDPEAYVPTSYMAYQMTQKEDDMWIAMAGCLADWYVPDFTDAFRKKYPGLLQKNRTAPQSLFKDKFGLFARALYFLLKGNVADVHKNISVINKLTSPYEFIEHKTAQSKFLYKHFKKIDDEFQEHIKNAKKQATRSKLLIYEYRYKRWSFNTLLATQLSSLYPKKALIIVRREEGLMKMSLRAPDILNPLQRALEGIEGSGGGHIRSCGATVTEHDWQRFINNLKREVAKEKW